MNVFTYWEGPQPEYIKVCIETMQLCCENFILLTPDNINSYLNDTGLHKNWDKLTNPAHRADCIRVAIINKYGGWWVDCDTIFVQPFGKDTIFNPGKDFLYMKWNDGRCLNGYFYGKAGCKLTSDWLSGINKKLSNLKSVQWTSFGEKLLTPLLREDNEGSQITKEIDRRTFLPINIDKIPWIFFEPVHWSSFITPDTVAVGLNNSWYRDNVKEFMCSSYPWDNNTLIGQLLNDFH